MCLNPVLIKNPNRGKHPVPGSPASLKDCTNEYIYVPCGHCAQCIAVKQMGFVQRVQMESLENHLFFATLTYKDDFLPRYPTSTGFSIPYVLSSDLQNMFKRLRRSDAFGRPFSYFAVSERGSKYGRPHAHVLFSVRKHDGDNFLDCLNLESIMFDAVLREWRRNDGSTFYPLYKPLCDFHRKFINGRLSATFDLHYCIPSATDAGLASVAFYVLKYMLKPSDKETRLQQALHLNLPEDEYERIWPVVRSRYYKSLNFGLNASAVTHIKGCVLQSTKNGLLFPCYFNPDTGSTFPLSRYYKSNGELYSFSDALHFYYLNDKPDAPADSPQVLDFKTPDQLNKAIYDYKKTLSRTRVDLLDSL